MNGPLRLLIPLGLTIIVAAAIYRVATSAPRRRLRRSVILYVLYALGIGANLAFHWAGVSAIASPLGVVISVLELLLVINLAAILLFDLFLHSLRWDFPDIVHDLVVGASYIVAIGWLMHRSGVDVTSIVATSAVVTAVVGLSLQATLGNLVGGIALQADDSIREGDWVELENKTQGQVKQIRWRHTVIETRDWATLIVPNSQLLAQTIKILGKRSGHPLQHRMWVHFNVDFRYPPGQVIQIVTDALLGAPIPNVASEPRPNCICYDLAREHRDSVACYAVRYWLTNLSSDDPTNSLVRERIYAALRRAQVPLALPATTVFVSRDDDEREARRLARGRASHITALDDTVLFARLSPEEKAYLADAVRPAPFSAGEVITRQGATAHWLYILTKGQTEIRVATASGEERKVADLNAPSFFGEMALMTGAPREATVIAKSDVECLRLDKDDFKDIIAQRPEIAQEISTILAQRRVELVAARDNLDAEAKKRTLITERRRILAGIRDFFGLNDEE